MNRNILLLLSCFFLQAFAQTESLMRLEDVHQINRKVENIQSQLDFKKNPTSKNYSLIMKERTYLPYLSVCITNENEILQELTISKKIYRQAYDIEYLTKQKEIYDKNYSHHQKLKKYCNFVKIKIENDSFLFQKFNYENFFKNASLQQEGFLSTLKQINWKNFPIPPKGEFLQQIFLSMTNLYLHLKYFLLGLLGLLSLNFLNKLGFKNQLTDVQIVYKNLFLCTLIFVISSPLIYHILKISYQQTSIIVLRVYAQPLLIGLFWVNLFYFYKGFIVKNYLQDFFKLILSLLIVCFLILCGLLKSYYESLQIASIYILLVKYGFLIFLQCSLVSFMYWVLDRFLEHKLFPNLYKTFFKCFAIGIVLNFIVGLMGFVDWAVNVDLSIIVSLTLIFWIYLFYKPCALFLKRIASPKDIYAKKIKEWFEGKSMFAQLNIKIFIYYFLAGMIVTYLFLFWNIWFFSFEIYNQVYALVFEPINILGNSIVWIRIPRTFALFILMNLVDLFLAQKLTIKIFRNPENASKFLNLFYALLLIFSLLVCLMLVGFDIKNLILILGSLSFGLGFGLRDFISSIFSSFLIFIYDTIKVGDFISISRYGAEPACGHVTKISLFETSICSLDNNVYIIPNSSITGSIITNHHFENNTTHAFHLKYKVESLEDIGRFKDKIIEILATQNSIINTKQRPYQIVLMPCSESSDTYEVELIVYIKMLHKIPETILQIHQILLEQLKKQGYQLSYLSCKHPYQ